jgi:hypothetical protein
VVSEVTAATVRALPLWRLASLRREDRIEVAQLALQSLAREPRQLGIRMSIRGDDHAYPSALRMELDHDIVRIRFDAGKEVHREAARVSTDPETIERGGRSEEARRFDLRGIYRRALVEEFGTAATAA